MVLGASILAGMTALAALAPILWETGAAALTPAINMGRSPDHPLGTDSIGRDVLLRTLVATRLTLVMAFLAIAVAACAGTLLGTGTALAGRYARGIGSRFIDVLVSYPPIIIALAIVAIFTPGRVAVVVAIGISFAPQFARLTSTLAKSVGSRDYITIARLLGVGRGRLLARHLLPNIAMPIVVLASVGFATSIVALSGLSFLGLGVQPPAYDWGVLLAEGLRDLFVNPIQSLGPALAILLTGLGAGLFGDGLAQYWDPRKAGPAAPRSRISGDDRRRPDSDVSGDRTARAAAAARPARMRSSGGDAVLAEVDDLRIWAGGVPLVRGVSLAIADKEIVGVVGESGSGKSLTAMALARLLHPELTWSAERLQVAGTALHRPDIPPPGRLATEVGVVFQDPSSSFNPALHIGPQLTEVLRVHKRVPRRVARDMAIAKLREVRVSSPELRMRQYPHELSGGMRQRAMIAMALLAEPSLLIADEPTTALDVTVQADVLRLLRQVNLDHGTGILLVTHDINVVSALCHRICVMYAGRIVEQIPVAELRAGRARHPYTQALLSASPTRSSDRRTRPLRPLPGRPPRPGEPGGSCSFAARCPHTMPRCRQHEPELLAIDDGAVACHLTSPELAGAR
jgi:peptide/nickel transport system permease protein